MATEHRIQLTGPELDERLAQVLTNEEDIGQEQQTRETTDEGMQEQLGALSTRMDAQDTTNEQVATDIENLQKAIGTGGSVDDKIAAAVGAEATAREAADTALGGRITTLEAAVGTGGSVDERIATEAAARTNADTALGNRMTTLEGSVDNRLDQQDAAIGLLDGHRLEVVDVLPTEQEPAVTPESDVIYRLVVTDSETGDVSYEDYMYNEDDLTTPKKIANYPLPGVDEEPTAGSKKLVESGGVAKAIRSIVDSDNTSAADLGFSDDKGNVVLQVNEGHIRTKYFDSSKDATAESRGLMSVTDKVKLNNIQEGAEVNNLGSVDSSNSDLSISDDNENTLIQCKEGHIRTKYFDSKETPKVNEDKTIKSFDENNEDNPLAVVKETPGLSAIIQDWGFIGDSLMSGVPHEHAVEAKDLVPMPNARNFYKYSWGQMMCRLCGSFGTNYSNGGQTAIGWLDMYPNNTLNRYNTDGTWPVNFSTTHKVAYAINFGTNDSSLKQYSGGLGTLENVHVNSEDYTDSDLTTFAGCYGKIISLCKEVSPSSRIFLITTPKIEFSNNEDIVNFTRELAQSELFSNVFLVDLCKWLTYKKSTIYGNGHLYTQGYQYIAYCFMTYVDYIIRKYPESFKNICYIEYLKEDSGQI